MESCNILGVQIAVTNIEKTVEYIEKNIHTLSGNYICVSNVHTTVMAAEDEVYKEIQNTGALALPDGGPLSFISRKKGYRMAERVTGPDLMEEIFKISEKKGYRHYFYGSTEKTLEFLEKELLKKYPRLQIVGMYSPPFREVTEEEDKEIINNINKVNANFIWVGLGAPKQEIWMYNHKNMTNGLMIGVGAGFDYHANMIKRAPKFMCKNNLEWLYRLIQEPRRLIKRYFKYNSKFIFKILKG